MRHKIRLTAILNLMDRAMAVQHAGVVWWKPVEVAVRRSGCGVSLVRRLEESDFFLNQPCGRPWFVVSL